MSDILMAGSTKAKKVADLMFLPPAERQSGYFLDLGRPISLDCSPAGLRQHYAALARARLFSGTFVRPVPNFWHNGSVVKGPQFDSNVDKDDLKYMTVRVFIDNDHLSIREASEIAARIRNWHNGPSIMQRLAVLEMQSKKKLDTARRRDYYVDGTINGAPVDALPDTGAGACFISPKVASGLSLTPDGRDKRTVRLANGTLVESPGTVDVKWRFDKQLNDIPVKCWVLPGCVHDMILGKEFLDATKTLTKVKKRIKSRLVDVSRRLRLQRIEVQHHVSQHLCGNLNGHFTTALADTGSDAMFVSSAYARKCGFEVDRGPDAQCEVEFANGSTQWTAGIVRDAVWTIGGRSIRSDFLVLDNLSEDVVLSKDYLFEEDVYTTANEYFIEFETRERGFYDLLNIRLLGKYGKDLRDVEEDYLNDIRSLDACRSDMLDRELLRRDLIRDHIATLPQHEQKLAYEAEYERQRLWQEARTKHASRVTHVTPTMQLPPLTHDAPPRVRASRRLKLVQGLLGTSHARNGLQKARKGIDAVRDGVATRTASWGSKHDTVAMPLAVRAQST